MARNKQHWLLIIIRTESVAILKKKSLKGGESTGGGEGAERANCSLKSEVWNFWLPLLALSVITQTNAILQSSICLVLVTLLLVYETLNGPGPK